MQQDFLQKQVIFHEHCAAIGEAFIFWHGTYLLWVCLHVGRPESALQQNLYLHWCPRRLHSKLSASALWKHAQANLHVSTLCIPQLLHSNDCIAKMTQRPANTQEKQIPSGQLLEGSKRVYCCSTLKAGSRGTAVCITCSQGALLLLGCGRISVHPVSRFGPEKVSHSTRIWSPPRKGSVESRERFVNCPCCSRARVETSSTPNKRLDVAEA